MALESSKRIGKVFYATLMRIINFIAYRVVQFFSDTVRVCVLIRWDLCNKLFSRNYIYVGARTSIDACA